jgi:hypothetical protein
MSGSSQAAAVVTSAVLLLQQAWIHDHHARYHTKKQAFPHHLPTVRFIKECLINGAETAVNRPRSMASDPERNAKYYDLKKYLKINIHRSLDYLRQSLQTHPPTL